MLLQYIIDKHTPPPLGGVNDVFPVFPNYYPEIRIQFSAPKGKNLVFRIKVSDNHPYYKGNKRGLLGPPWGLTIAVFCVSLPAPETMVPMLTQPQ